MKILILGGTGLISTAITRMLLGEGHEVVHFNRGIRRNEFSGQVTVVVGKRDSMPDLQRARDLGNFDAVIDMICFSETDAAVAIEVFAGTVIHYVLCSTVDVFTKTPTSYPVTETGERNPSPSFPYAFAKRRCESLFEAAAERGAIELTIIRPGATYDDGAVAPFGSYQLYVERLREGQPIIIHGDGTSLWVAAHRDDVARAFIAAVANPITFGRSYNVTGSELMTWNRYWQTVASALGVEASIVHVPTDVLGALAPIASEWCVENFQYNNVFDNSAARTDLDFDYTTSWEVGCSTFTFDFPNPVPADLSMTFNTVLSIWQKAINDAEAMAVLHAL